MRRLAEYESKGNGFIYIPDIFIDEHLMGMRPGMLKVFLYIKRHTEGLGKEEDGISLEQFCNGTISRDGKILDGGTGLRRPCVIQALNYLEAGGYIGVRKTLGRVKIYWIKPSYRVGAELEYSSILGGVFDHKLGCRWPDYGECTCGRLENNDR